MVYLGSFPTVSGTDNRSLKLIIDLSPFPHPTTSNLTNSNLYVFKISL